MHDSREPLLTAAALERRLAPLRWFALEQWANGAAGASVWEETGSDVEVESKGDGPTRKKKKRGVGREEGRDE